MKRTHSNNVNTVRRRLQIEDALAQYPDVPSDTLADLVDWFKREASAFEVGMIASNPDIYESYRRFRREHLERLTVPEIVGVIGCAILIVLGAVAVALSH